MEVQESAQQVPPAIEQAAMLYSVEQPAAACAALEEAVREQDLGDYALRAWGMLFELYQLLGRQEDFERLAVEYAARFESSPPAWAGTRKDAGEAAVRPAGSVAVPIVSISAGKIQEAVKLIFKAAEKGPSVKLDLGRVADADDDGCALLNEALSQLKRKRKEFVMAGADKAAGFLQRKLAAGRKDNEQAWLLLLELLQQLGDQQAFDEAAVNYAITFEVSPPSWEPVRAKRRAVAEAVAKPDVEERNDCCALEGSITSNSDKAFADMRSRAEAAAGEIVVDVSRLQRMDFVAAANLMNLVSALEQRQKKVRFVKASHLLTALWEIIGLDRVASIETRKA